ncbi:hypothetical protein ACI1MP_04580 [Kitasatospora griseola]|uniref:hypothetical protein n=1 Tax=Kitasatospora griseola TaxID=2064 RepID=UPI003855E006
MVPGVEIAVGYVFAWAVRKARLVAGRADGEVDRVLETGMDRVHDLVTTKLGQDPALTKAVAEAGAETAVLSANTRQWLALSLNDRAEQDPQFAAALLAAVQAVQNAERSAGVSASGDGIAVGGPVTINATGAGSVAAMRIDGPVTVGVPAPTPPPGKAQD